MVMIEQKLSSSGSRVEVALVLKNLARVGAGADHQRVPARNDLRIELRLLALPAGVIKLLPHARNSLFLILGDRLRQIENVLIRRGRAVLRIGEIRPAVQPIDSGEELCIVEA